MQKLLIDCGRLVFCLAYLHTLSRLGMQSDQSYTMHRQQYRLFISLWKFCISLRVGGDDQDVLFIKRFYVSNKSTESNKSPLNNSQKNNGKQSQHNFSFAKTTIQKYYCYYWKRLKRSISVSDLYNGSKFRNK